MALNVKAIFYRSCSSSFATISLLIRLSGVSSDIQVCQYQLSLVLVLMVLSLTPLLEKDATAFDPGRVINMSSTASVHFRADGTRLSAPGTGLWSCKISLTFMTVCPAQAVLAQITRAKRLSTICLPPWPLP